MKEFIKKILSIFSKPLIMSVYKDKFGNKYGGVIHKKDGKSYVNIVNHIKEPTYLGEIEIY